MLLIYFFFARSFYFFLKNPQEPFEDFLLKIPFRKY